MANPHHGPEYYSPPAGLELRAYLAAGNKQGVHHTVRYLWAIEALRQIGGATAILDFGCGEGYGAYALACANPNTEVVALDYDGQAIAAAVRKYRKMNLRYMVADTRQWYPELEERFDLAISFDVLEHVEHRELFFYNLTRYIRADGHLFLSTPCGGTRPVRANPGWEHHKIEYNARALYDILRRYFNSVLRIDDPETEFPGRYVFERLASSSVQYLNVLNPVICANPIKIEDPYAGYLAGLEQQVALAERVSAGEQQRSIIDAQRARIAQLEQQISRLQSKLKHRERPLVQRLVRKLWKTVAS